MLHRYAKITSGDSVLFHAAGSGVGTIQLQLGKLLELEMYATASKGKHELLNDYGAVAIDYKREDFVRRVRAGSRKGVDAAFDPVGGSHLWRSFKTLKSDGQLIAYGEMAVTGPQKPRRSEVFWQHNLPSWLNYFPGKRTVRFYEAYDDVLAHRDWYDKDLSALITLLADGKIKPVIADHVPLHETARAHELLEKAAVRGKIVIDPWQ
jgi:NADPH2:quinone reductase